MSLTKTPDLISAQARICFTSAAFLVSRQKVLLVKHKKLGIWLVPGGHLEPQELPHLAAERECYEETGIKVKTVSAAPILNSQNSQSLPLPFTINLHWISKDNYQARLNSTQPHLPHHTQIWPKGCEQHLVFCYLVKPTGSFKLIPDPAEVDAIGWFGANEIDTLDTTPNIKQELKLVLSK